MMPVVPPRSRWTSRALTVLVLVVVIAGLVAWLAWRQSAPGVRAAVTPTPRLLGRATILTVALDAARGNVAAAEVRLVQGAQAVVVVRQDAPAGPHWEAPVTVQAAALGLKEGAATLEVWASDDYWRPLSRRDRPVASLPVTVDLTPPSIDILAATRYLFQGGGGLVVFRLRGADRAEVRAGTLSHPSFPAGVEDTRMAFLALPWNLVPGTPLTVTAQDEAGNSASRGIPAEIRPRRFRTDTIEVTDALLRAKVPELLPRHAPDQPLIDAFLTINRDQRNEAEAEKRRVATRTAERALWSGPFVQPRNTKVFSNFAETRTYVYQGKTVDTQVHLGYDLASVQQSPVPAANRGVVAFAGPLTIYGNTVIVDHGLGLQTLYGHLSSIEAKVGDQVGKGQTLGRTGSTGLAVGDHLHFEVLIGGVSVTPVEWWDERWIRDHIGQPLLEAGVLAIGGAEYREVSANPTRPPNHRGTAPRR
jgi:murein DD-endopeptidase MepM/ murein hydrolase activator NlpD